MSESVPNTLNPGRDPHVTPLQRARELLSDANRATLFGRRNIPLSPRALQLAGQPCPGGWNSENGYNRHNCRCETCRAAHRAGRLERKRRAA